MSIRNGLLALLEHGPRYGYQLRAEFEATTGGTWPLNIGQVYSTLRRLERDGLVAGTGTDDEGRSVYEITAAGRSALTDWFTTPIARAERGRDELAIKLAVAVTLPAVDLRDVIQRQRSATLRSLQEFTRLKRAADPDGDLAWLLVVDSMIFAAEAEVRWLDHCETQLGRRRSAPTAPSTAPTQQPQAQELPR